MMMAAPVPDEDRQPLRRDAQVRREALLAAAAECFGEAGFMVPLEQIAERAGVGRGTLYRNFKDRLSLAIAIFEREIDAAQQLLDPAQPIGETLARLVRHGAQATSLFQRIAVDLPLTEENRGRFDAVRARLSRLLEPVAARGRATGRLRADVTADDLVLATRMLSGLMLRNLPPCEADASLHAALALLLKGLEPKG